MNKLWNRKTILHKCLKYLATGVGCQLILKFLSLTSYYTNREATLAS